MSDIILHYTRSLLYGAVVTCLIHYVVVLMDTLQGRQGAKERLVFGVSLVGMVCMLLQYTMWFIVDAMELPHNDVAHVKLWGTLNFFEMSTPLLFQVAFFSMAYLKPMRWWWLCVLYSPLILLYVAFVATNNWVLVSIGYYLNLITAVVVPVVIIFMVRRYQRLLNDTYANTSGRSVTWIIKLLLLMCCIYVAWVVASFLIPSVLGDCLYMLLSIVLWGVYTYRLKEQNFNIEYMLEVEPLPEGGDNNDEVDNNAVDDDSVTVASVAMPRTKLKAWQEPAFGAAVQRFCTQQDNFSNPDLSVQDVAMAVGTNRTYISRWCNEQMVDFSSYITNIRLDYVEDLLVNSSETINDIADMAGFSSSRHMRSAFVGRHGFTPSVYRNNHSEKIN